ncbi:hypothetical protein [Rhizobium miluonense]|jgi:hypothetical protein|uniref:Uncharacterized protein n=1 Tax=Rhizobium miluonense TaxID=411945 RepID=A0ABU1SXL7_9HYPH|nr:hypothetical protein [Rhizobium miluonense]MDR6903719.1 hypothetical protein [Rhizobium miluonense]
MTKPVRINGPSKLVAATDAYHKECMFAMEPSLVKLMDLAIEAGWDHDQVALAFVCFAMSRLDGPKLSNAEKSVIEFTRTASIHKN